MRTDGADPSAMRRTATDLARTAFGSAFGAAVAEVLSATLVEALLGDGGGGPPAEAGLRLARERAACGLSAVSIGGASVQSSHARGGLVIKGAPLSARVVPGTTAPRAQRPRGKSLQRARRGTPPHLPTPCRGAGGGRQSTTQSLVQT